MNVILEIARGDSIPTLIANGVIKQAVFSATNGDRIGGYAVIGGTNVPATLSGEMIEFAGYKKRKNAYGFSHGQRPIYKQATSGCYLIDEVFIG